MDLIFTIQNFKVAVWFQYSADFCQEMKKLVLCDEYKHEPHTDKLECIVLVGQVGLQKVVLDELGVGWLDGGWKHGTNVNAMKFCKWEFTCHFQNPVVSENRKFFSPSQSINLYICFTRCLDHSPHQVLGLNICHSDLALHEAIESLEQPRCH